MGGGGGGGKGGGSKFPPVVQTFVEPARAVVDTAVKTATAVVDTTKDVAKVVGDTAYDIKKNPTVATVLPVIETAALVTVGVPPPVASAAVAAANGASVEQIATSAAASFVGGQVGGAAGTAAASAGADAVTANIVGSAAGSATKSALQGGSAEDVLKAAAGGAAGSGVGSFAAGQGADVSTVKGIQQATGTLATTGDPTKALVAGGGAYLTQEARDSIKQPPAPVETRTPTPVAEAPLTLDQQLAELIQQQPPVDRTQDVQLAGPMVEGALPVISEAERIRQENAARELSPLEPQQIEDRTVVPVEAPSPDLQDVFINAPEFNEPVVTDQAIIDLITPREEVRTLPEVTVTPGPEEPERDFDFPDLPEETPADTTLIDELPELPEEEVLPTEEATPYKPELFITGSKSPKPYQPRSTTRLGGVTAFAPQTGLSQALTAVRPAGETEGTGTGKERQQVWNEASLRLKDALGI